MKLSLVTSLTHWLSLVIPITCCLTSWLWSSDLPHSGYATTTNSSISRLVVVVVVVLVVVAVGLLHSGLQRQLSIVVLK